MDSKFKNEEINIPPPPYDRGSYDEAQNYGEEGASASPSIGGRGKVHQVQVKQGLAAWKCMRTMVVIELILGLIALIFGISCVATVQNFNGAMDNKERQICIDGSGIWVGLLCIATGIVGLLALAVPSGRRSLLISHLVLCILSAVGCGLLLIFSSVWTAAARANYNSSHRSFDLAVLSFNVILIIVAIVHLVLSIISASLLCHNFNRQNAGHAATQVISSRNVTQYSVA